MIIQLQDQVAKAYRGTNGFLAKYLHTKNARKPSLLLKTALNHIGQSVKVLWRGVVSRQILEPSFRSRLNYPPQR